MIPQILRPRQVNRRICGIWKVTGTSRPLRVPPQVLIPSPRRWSTMASKRQRPHQGAPPNSPATLIAKKEWLDEDLRQAMSLIQALTRRRTPASLADARTLLERMCKSLAETSSHVGIFQYWSKGTLPLSTKLVNAILDSWRIVMERQPDRVASPALMLEQIEGLSIPLDSRSYTYIMQSADEGEFSEGVLSRMMSRGIRPDAVALSTAIRSWGNSDRDDAAKCLDLLWHEILTLYDEDYIDAPNTITVNTYLEAICRRGTRQAMEQAERLFEELPSYSFNFSPDTVTFRILIYGWAQLGDLDSIERGFQLLQEAVESPIYATDDSIQIAEAFYSKLVSCLARRGRSEQAIALGEEIYDHLKRWHAVNHEQTVDTRTRQALIMLYNKGNRALRAEKMIYELETEADERTDTSILPENRHYRDTTLSLLNDKSIEDGLERATNLLMSMMQRGVNSKRSIKPSSTLLGSVLKAWSRSRRYDAADRTEELFRLAQKMDAEEAESEHDHTPRVDARAFLFTVRAWAFSNRLEAAERAEDLLFEMYLLYAKGIETMRPTNHVFAAVITAWGRSGVSSAPQSINDLFQEANRLCEPSRDITLYAASINAFCEANDPKSAEKIIDCMMTDATKPSPTAEFFEVIVSSYLKSTLDGKDDLVHNLLRKMKQLVRDGAIRLPQEDFSFSLLLESLS